MKLILSKNETQDNTLENLSKIKKRFDRIKRRQDELRKIQYFSYLNLSMDQKKQYIPSKSQFTTYSTIFDDVKDANKEFNHEKEMIRLSDNGKWNLNRRNIRRDPDSYKDENN